jgi:hypothetical protein
MPRGTVISHGKEYSGEVVRDSPPDMTTGIAGLIVGSAFGPGVAARIWSESMKHEQTVRTDRGRTVTGEKKR